MAGKEEKYIISTLSKINRTLRGKIDLPDEFFALLSLKAERYMDEISYNPDDTTYTNLTDSQRKQIDKLGTIVKKVSSILKKTYYEKVDALLAMRTYSRLVIELLNEVDINDQIGKLKIS